MTVNNKYKFLSIFFLVMLAIILVALPILMNIGSHFIDENEVNVSRYGNFVDYSYSLLVFIFYYVFAMLLYTSIRFHLRNKIELKLLSKSSLIEITTVIVVICTMLMLFNPLVYFNLCVFLLLIELSALAYYYLGKLYYKFQM